MKRFILLFAGIFAIAQKPGVCASVSVPPTVVVSSVSATFGGAITITISTPTGSGSYSTGYSNYFTHIHLEAIGNGTSGAVPVTCTSTNLSGLQYNFSLAVSTGPVSVQDIVFDNPLQSTSTALSTLTCPANVGFKWNGAVNYFVAP